MAEPVINLHFNDPCVISADEYETIRKDVMARAITGATETGDRVLAHLLVNMEYRYYACKKEQQ